MADQDPSLRGGKAHKLVADQDVSWLSGIRTTGGPSETQCRGCERVDFVWSSTFGLAAGRNVRGARPTLFDTCVARKIIQR